jgi:glycosyltransferase involved in cell wall biosynthesis
MLKICIVNPFEHGGGAEYQISLLIDALSADGGYEVHYLTHFIDQRQRTRNYSVSVAGGGGPIPRLGYVMDARSLYRTLREIGPQVIYQRVACAYTGICALYSLRRGVPMIWHVAHDSDVAPRLLEPARNFVRRRLEKWAVSFGARNATGIVVQSRCQSELLRENYCRSADALIPNFHPPASESIDKSGPLTVIWIANLKPWKRPEVFVRLAAHFSTRTDLRFIMVGAPAAATGNHEWRKSLMCDIEGAHNLQYVGQKTHAEVNRLLARSHVFVNTSTHEGFPNTFIQAWMRGAAVVSLSVDPDNVLERERVGIAAHTEAGLETAVRRLIDEPELLAGYSKRGSQHAAAHHSMANTARLVQLIGTYARRSEV